MSACSARGRWEWCGHATRWPPNASRCPAAAAPSHQQPQCKQCRLARGGVPHCCARGHVGHPVVVVGVTASSRVLQPRLAPARNHQPLCAPHVGNAQAHQKPPSNRVPPASKGGGKFDGHLQHSRLLPQHQHLLGMAMAWPCWQRLVVVELEVHGRLRIGDVAGARNPLVRRCPGH